jgi:hypothetical protein
MAKNARVIARTCAADVCMSVRVILCRFKSAVGEVFEHAALSVLHKYQRSVCVAFVRMGVSGKTSGATSEHRVTHSSWIRFGSGCDKMHCVFAPRENAMRVWHNSLTLQGIGRSFFI